MSETFSESFSKYLWPMVLILTMLVLAGCQSPMQLGARATTASANVSTDLGTVRGILAQLLPSLSPSLRPKAQAADDAAADAQAQMPAIDKGLAQIPPLVAKVDKLEHQFFSPVQIGIARTAAIVACLYLLWLGFCVIGFTALGYPALGRALFRVSTLGLTKGLHGVDAWLQAHWDAKEAELALAKPVNVGTIGGVPVAVNPTPAPGSSLVVPPIVASTWSFTSSLQPGPLETGASAIGGAVK